VNECTSLMYGVSLAALGMLSNLATCLSIDVYGPICDNAGGIAEMAEMPESVRDVTDALDAAVWRCTFTQYCIKPLHAMICVYAR